MRVSPFYVQMNAVGAPSFPYSPALGTATQIVLAGSTIGLFLGAFWPRSVWRKPVFWLSLSGIVEIFLSFALMLHSAQVTLMNIYGAAPPLIGSGVIPGRVIGLDLSLYQSPATFSSFALPFYLGLASLAVLGGSQTIQLFVNPRAETLTLDFMKGLSGVFLSPPYQHAWLTSPDQDLNPLSQDPDQMGDDDLALSFEKLQETLQPGAIVSIILPSWAGYLANRLSRVVPWTGFNLERSELIYRFPGQPENELVFRKPANAQQVGLETGLDFVPKRTGSVQEGEIELDTHLPVEVAQPPAIETFEGPPIAEAIEDPIWAQPQMTRGETVMIRSAMEIIARHQQPVPYRELLNEVYMELLDRRIDFESVREIETTLLNHSGRELNLIEELDETGAYVIKKWWLGERGASVVSGHRRRVRSIIAKARKGFPRLKQALDEWNSRDRTGYKPRKQPEDD